jgi:hypothetical protein
MSATEQIAAMTVPRRPRISWKPPTREIVALLMPGARRDVRQRSDVPAGAGHHTDIG